jgi:hypothetical protein
MAKQLMGLHGPALESGRIPWVDAISLAGDVEDVCFLSRRQAFSPFPFLELIFVLVLPGDYVSQSQCKVAQLAKLSLRQNRARRA